MRYQMSHEIMYYLGDKGLNYKLCKKPTNFNLLLPQWCPAYLSRVTKHRKGPSHTLQSPSSSKQEVCNKPSISWSCHHGYQNFGFYALWKPTKCTLQDRLLSQMIPKQLNFTLSLRELSLISIWHNNTNFNNSLFNSTALFIPQYFSKSIDSQTCSRCFFR